MRRTDENKTVTSGTMDVPWYITCRQKDVTTRKLSNEEQYLHLRLAVAGWHRPWAEAEQCLHIPGETTPVVPSYLSSSRPPAITHPRMQVTLVEHTHTHTLVGLVILAPESHHKGSNAPSAKSPDVDQGRMRPGHWLRSMLCIPFSALTTMVGWHPARKTSHSTNHQSFPFRTSEGGGPRGRGGGTGWPRFT